MEQLYDVIVVGGGPAGLTAALYLARARYRVLVLEKEQFGGQITITDEVVNYPGIAKISGKALTEAMRAQAESFGAEFLLAEATGLELSGNVKIVRTERGEPRCFGVLLATGARPRTVGFQGEEAYKGRGVAYCATCDGEFFTGKDVFVVGGGFAAAEESVFLTKFAKKVTILVRKSDFSCAASLAERAKNHEKITVLTNTVLEEVSGEDALTYARYKNTATGEVTEFCSEESFGVFVFAGYEPATEAFRELVDCDEHGYIRTNAAGMTNVEGVYAAGDVCIKPLRQVVTATADGALAATELEHYVGEMQRKTGLRPQQPEKNAGQPAQATDSNLFDAGTKGQLEQVFQGMERKLRLKLHLDGRPISGELEKFTRELANLTEKLEVEIGDRQTPETEAPWVQVCREDGRETGLAFHGVPGGHEFTSFVLGLYNAAGRGQTIDQELRRQIAELDGVDMKILVTLSCGMCPELVTAAQKIAAENEKVRAEVYDVSLFPQLREKYRVMSVPCLVVNDTRVAFGKKNLRQLLEFLREA